MCGNSYDLTESAFKSWHIIKHYFSMFYKKENVTKMYMSLKRQIPYSSDWWSLDGCHQTKGLCVALTVSFCSTLKRCYVQSPDFHLNS